MTDTFLKLRKAIFDTQCIDPSLVKALTAKEHFRCILPRALFRGECAGHFGLIHAICGIREIDLLVCEGKVFCPTIDAYFDRTEFEAFNDLLHIGATVRIDEKLSDFIGYRNTKSHERLNAAVMEKLLSPSGIDKAEFDRLRYNLPA